MTLNIKRHIYAHGDSYDIINDKKAVIYTAKGDIFSQGAKLCLYGDKGQELVFINQKRMVNTPTYEIEINGTIFATLNRQITWRKTTIEVDSKNGKFLVSSDFKDDEFNITFNGLSYGTVKKDTHTREDVYVLTVDSEEHIEFFVAMLLAIDNLIRHEKSL